MAVWLDRAGCGPAGAGLELQTHMLLFDSVAGVQLAFLSAFGAEMRRPSPPPHHDRPHSHHRIDIVLFFAEIGVARRLWHEGECVWLTALLSRNRAWKCRVCPRPFNPMHLNVNATVVGASRWRHPSVDSEGGTHVCNERSRWQ